VLGLLLVLAFLTPPLEAAEPGPEEGPSPTGALLRSIVLPGWGQVANGQWLKGGLFFTAYGGFIAWGVSINQDLQDAKGNPDVTEAELSSLTSSRNAKYWLAGLTLFLSAVDAYVDAHLNHFDDKIDADVGMLPGEEGPLLGLSLSTHWGGPSRGR